MVKFKVWCETNRSIDTIVKTIEHVLSGKWSVIFSGGTQLYLYGSNVAVDGDSYLIDVFEVPDRPTSNLKSTGKTYVLAGEEGHVNAKVWGNRTDYDPLDMIGTNLHLGLKTRNHNGKIYLAIGEVKESTPYEAVKQIQAIISVFGDEERPTCQNCHLDHRQPFEQYLEAEKDIYGFADKEPQKPEPKPEEELPIQPFSLNRLIDRLAKTKVGSYESFRPFEDQAQWGREDGAIRARLTPNQGMSVERLTSDLQGRPLWVTKKLFKIKTNEFAGIEDSVASELGDHIQNLSMERVDSPAADFRGLYALTCKMVERVKHNVHDMFVYQELKKVSDNNYNILFSLIGSGVGKLSHRKSGGGTPAGIIDLSYDPERGSIKGILCTVSVENDADPWEIDTPFLLSNFSPSQPTEEIVRVVVNALKFI